jgi:hypothetical protein
MKARLQKWDSRRIGRREARTRNIYDRNRIPPQQAFERRPTIHKRYSALSLWAVCHVIYAPPTLWNLEFVLLHIGSDYIRCTDIGPEPNTMERGAKYRSRKQAGYPIGDLDWS